MESGELANITRVLVYKRTHNGDPNAGGEFGCNDCMGTVRDRNFDAVIGVGGISATSYRMEGRITWIGILPLETEQERAMRMVRNQQTRAERKVVADGEKRSTARLVTFRHFLAFRECGYFPPSKHCAPMFTDAPAAPWLKDYAPVLAGKLLRNQRAPRILDQNDSVEFAEAKSILLLATSAPPSPKVKHSSARSESERRLPATESSATSSCRPGAR